MTSDLGAKHLTQANVRAEIIKSPSMPENAYNGKSGSCAPQPFKAPGSAKRVKENQHSLAAI